jgi:hypothetical protein
MGIDEEDIHATEDVPTATQRQSERKFETLIVSPS